MSRAAQVRKKRALRERDATRATATDSIGDGSRQFGQWPGERQDQGDEPGARREGNFAPRTPIQAPHYKRRRIFPATRTH